MNANAAVIALCALSLGATGYVALSLPKPEGDRIAELEAKLDAADKRADAVESLRTEVREMRSKLDRRIADVGERVSAAQPAPAVVAARSDGRVAMGAGDMSGEAFAPSASGKSFDELVADRIEKKMSEKMEALAARDKERGDDGKWKAPIDELAKELSLTDVQKAETKRIFDRTRDDSFALLKTMRLDGGSLLDDFAGALKGGADPGETTKQFFSRIFTEKVPGSDQTYLAEFVAMTQDTEAELGRQLGADQMKRLKSLHVDLLDVKTGYDPIGDYIRAKVQ